MSPFQRPRIRTLTEARAKLEGFLPTPHGFPHCRYSRAFDKSLDVTLAKMRQTSGLDALLAWLIDETPRIYKRTRRVFKQGVAERFLRHMEYLDAQFERAWDHEKRTVPLRDLSAYPPRPQQPLLLTE